jgi:hypothetical protein
MVVCFVSIYDNRTIKPVEIVLRSREEKRENNGGGKSNKIYWKYICKYHNVSSCTTIVC